MIYNKANEQGVEMDIKSLKINEIKKKVGIRRILELITGKKVALVGYEMLQDLMFLYHWCIDRLPSRCEDFIRNVHSEFPFVIDVQVILVLFFNDRQFCMYKVWLHCCRILLH